MDKNQKIQIIKDILENKSIPPFDSLVILQKDGKYRLTRLGKEYLLSEEEFKELNWKQGPIILPDNKR